MSQEFTLDKVLFSSDLLVSKIPVKDQKIISSLQKQLTQGNFLTEGQANLLVKIFKENANIITTSLPIIQSLLDNPKWSRSFRVIPKIRKITFGSSARETIKVEFTFDKRLKHKLMMLTSELDHSFLTVGTRDYTFSLTEKNIYLLVKEFINNDFEIDQEILNFYYEISEIIKNKETQFDVFSMNDSRHKEHIQNSTGGIDKNNLLILHDKRIAYQYEILDNFEDISLAATIAKRKNPKIFVDSKKFTLTEIVNSLSTLHRLPLLVVFEGHDSRINKFSLEVLRESLENNNLIDDVGIYFRFDKDTDAADFNNSIATLKFNKNLTNTTNIVGIANNKLPKFMVKMGWKPKSIISFTNNFKNNKSSVYFSDVDLVMFYNDKKPLGDDIDDVV
jgi:hypothetical protein